MSDVPGKGATAPMNQRATQMSASAVPSTLESPKDPPKHDTTERMEDVPTAKGEHLPVIEIHGASVLQGEPVLRADPARELALLRETAELEPAGHRSGGPRTLMSPAVPQVAAPKEGPNTAASSPEDAVTFAPPFPIVPGHSFGVVQGSGAPPALGAHGAHAQHGPHPHGHAGFGAVAGAPAEPRRSMSTTMIVLLVGGALLAIFVIGSIVTGLYIFRARQAEAEAQEQRRQQQRSFQSTPSLPLETAPPPPPSRGRR